MGTEASRMHLFKTTKEIMRRIPGIQFHPDDYSRWKK
ncbi:hypothetical protein SAMN00777080_1452 [Aquiflexum balticum DSM 16537]|uniref:Uncharacterized protein n=1 Tax=Aquiflexum balticum DSM 16537 TaxID=758820 RepID=A0A1W2H1R5_9BACT|nr:hypothetical protein SAMN00777080_1452 [Aquiflexum balticum DSM 16537]